MIMDSRDHIKYQFVFHAMTKAYTSRQYWHIGMCINGWVVPTPGQQAYAEHETFSSAEKTPMFMGIDLKYWLAMYIQKWVGGKERCDSEREGFD